MKPAGPLETALHSLEAEFEVVLGKLAVVEAACRTVHDELASHPDAEQAARLAARLLPLLQKRRGALLPPVVALLGGLARRGADPGAILGAVLELRDETLREAALALLLSLARDGTLALDSTLLERLAPAIDAALGASPAAALLEQVESALRGPARPAAGDPLEALLLTSASPDVRRLAARLLDRAGALPTPEFARRLVGEEAARFLTPHLDFTRATHRDLVEVVPVPGAPPPGLPSWVRAEAVLGRELLGRVFAELGWARAAWGLHVQHLVGLSLDGSFPFVVSPPEAELLGACGAARRVWERFLVIAHGGQAEDANAAAGSEAVQRFRTYNLRHAELLGHILEIGPLTAVRARQVMELLDRTVEDFVALFQEHAEEAARLPAFYAVLRDKVEAALAAADASQPLGHEATRLVQMFEDARHLDEVRTLHGLKRYLHQRGLRLAFRAFRSARTTNRTVDLVLTSSERVLSVTRQIRYVDFEPATLEDGTDLPFSVALLAASLGRQLVYGQEKLPLVEVFLYGNEVQLFVSFRNHPAFLRVDLSPPLRGGMIDLEYFGVSQYEMDQHPDRSLQAIRRLCRDLDFDVTLEGFRLHVRYDKERTFDPGDIVEKTGSIFRLLPYLMDLDWVVGSLDYPPPVRAAVAAAWSRFFLQWGTLPLEAFLTPDRRHVLLEIATDPAGERAIAWDGTGAYRDRFADTPPMETWERLRTELVSRGLGGLARWPGTYGTRPAQLLLQDSLFEPLRAAVRRGEAVQEHGRYAATPAALFEREHEAERLARLLAAGGEPLHQAMRAATLVGAVERQLQFRTTGSVQGYEVQSAALELHGETLGVFVLRDGQGMAAAALAVPGGVLYHKRTAPDAAWTPNECLPVELLAQRLRRDNYLIEGYEPAEPPGGAAPAALAARFRSPNPLAAPPAGRGERVLPGIAASPGKATGFALFGTANRAPSDFDGAVLVSPTIRPEATPWLRHAAAAVTTGGGMLSHIGLIAVEMQKPALILGGCWDTDALGASLLVVRRPEFRAEETAIDGWRVVCHRDLVEVDEVVREGDLLVVDADAGLFTILGQDRDALALHRDLRQLEIATGELGAAREPAELLVLRGRVLRALYQLEKLLGRIGRPELASHAVGELLYGSSGAPTAAERTSRRQLLQALFANPACGAQAREAARQRVAALAQRFTALAQETGRILPQLEHAGEIALARQRVRRTAALLDELTALLGEEAPGAPRQAAVHELEALAVGCLAARRQALAASLAAAAAEAAMAGDEVTRAAPMASEARHWLRRAEQLDALLGAPRGAASDAARAALRERLARAEAATSAALAARRIVGPQDGGFELGRFAGPKAGNLAEMDRILGPGVIPAWFAVTDAAFRAALAAPVPVPATGLPDGELTAGISLGEAIHTVLARRDHNAGRRAAAIRHLWEAASLPEDLAAELVAAYRQLGGGTDAPEPLVAIRSSAFEEDTEQTAWAGQFDTFLFVSGEAAVLAHLRRAWAGLWSERAIHQREALGTGAGQAGGGVIVQRMADARVAGVLQTAYVAGGQLCEMVINAGLGLGEGVVSGAVDVDQILVSKEAGFGPEPLRFRYTVGDKRQRVVFDERRGTGTRLEETLYHQRLRAALEYVELCELVRAASRIEHVYGQPLDIEFAFEGTALRILQARPIGIFHAAVQDTVARDPLVSTSQPDGVTHDSSR